jgi:hypothetical protein
MSAGHEVTLGGVSPKTPTRYNAGAMSLHRLLIATGALVLWGCSSGPDLEWMKVNQPYTAADFRRDYAECEKTGPLEE